MDDFPCTLRLTGLPLGTTTQQIEKHLLDRVLSLRAQDLKVGQVHSHIHREVTESAIITCSSSELAQKVLLLERPSRMLNNGSRQRIFEIDAKFPLLTTLHTSEDSGTGSPNVDIVIIHDLYGHPWSSFASSNGRESMEGNWIRDSLPRLLQAKSDFRVHPRIMSFGYRPDLWITQPLDRIQRTEYDLFQSLQNHRKEDPDRPLFYIAHGLGGFLAKQTYVALANKSAINSEIKAPPAGFVFFGVPNQVNGSVSPLQQFNLAYGQSETLVDEDNKVKYIANFSTEFSMIREDNTLPVLSVIEAQQANSIRAVEPDAAIFNYPQRPEPCILQDKNHFTMTQFAATEQKLLEPVITFLSTSIEEAHELQSLRQEDPDAVDVSFVDNLGDGEEDPYSILTEYDTVFLVDDSLSMQASGRWQLVQKVLAHATEITPRYDPDGIEVRFFNNARASRNHITDPQQARNIVQSVNPSGRTPTLNRLQEYLRTYIQDFREHRQKQDRSYFPKYNLIILTDGGPDKSFEHPEEISDAEDAAKNSAANRKIRKEIVNTANQLDDMNAVEGQIGIQFCQIGNDAEVAKFFDYLDNDLRVKYDVRDMVDTVRCIDERSLSPDFYLELLTGAIDPSVDNRPQKSGIVRPRRAPAPQPTPRPAPRTWNANKKPTQTHSGSDSVVPLAGKFQRVQIVDDDYTYDAQPTSDAAAYNQNQTTGQESSNHPFRRQTVPSSMHSDSETRRKPKKKDRFSFFRHDKHGAN